MATPLILIVGAGPTGMSAAIELKRAGLNVRIVDKAEHLALHSQALVVQARTLEQFQRYGIAEKAVARGRKVIRGVLWSDGKRILKVHFDRIMSRYPYVLMLPQNETETILNETMESLGAKTERGIELVSIKQEAADITAVLRHPDGNEEEVNPRWIIGCDGAHSTVREKLGIPFEGKGVGLSFFLGDLEVDGSDAPDDELSIHLHRGGDAIFLVRLTDRLTRVIVAVHAKQGKEMQKDLTLKDFQGALDRAEVKVKVHASEWMTPFHVHDLQARRYRRGNVFLAGDASHIHSPVGGQGMNTGVQDAANLGWKLAAVARGGDPVLLDSYEEERSAVGRALLRFTERGLKLATSPNPLVEALRDDLLPAYSILTPVQKAMMGFISETGIEYRSSSIAKDFGGDGYLMAGDRMPDLGLKGGGSRTLLQNWTEAKHLAVLLDPTAAELAEIRARLPFARVVTVSVRELFEEGLRAMGTEKKLWIVRPDGYIGFRGIVEPHIPWTEYSEQDGLVPSNSLAFR